MKLDEFEKRHKDFLGEYDGEHTNFAKTITVLIAVAKAARKYIELRNEFYEDNDDQYMSDGKLELALKDMEKE